MLVYFGLIAAGFLACTVVGSLAWYASERPAGWENAAAPAWVKALGVERLRRDGVN